MIVDLETTSEKVCIATCADKIHNLQVSVDGIKEQEKSSSFILKEDTMIKNVLQE